MEAVPRVRTRRVHYIAGFDPRGARYYHRLYRDESAKQSVLNSGELTVGKRESIGEYTRRWQIEARWGDEMVSTDYQFMEWDDIVRKHWGGGLFSVLMTGLRSYALYGWCGALRKGCATYKNAFNCALYPWGYLCAAILLVAIAALLGSGVVYALTSSATAACAVGAAFAIGTIIAASIGAERFGITWLIRTYGFVLAWGTGKLPDLRKRIGLFAEHILLAQEREPVDEVLIVGHSVGAMAAVSVAAQVLRRRGTLADRMHLLTLGSCIPFLSLIPAAALFREDLATLANDDRMLWTDVAVPSDPLCFYEVSPLEASGIVPSFPNRPRQIMARIFRMFRPETYAKLRRNKLRIHFQYLMAAELPSEYDYFRITAGPEKLRSSD